MLAHSMGWHRPAYCQGEMLKCACVCMYVCPRQCVCVCVTTHPVAEVEGVYEWNGVGSQLRQQLRHRRLHQTERRAVDLAVPLVAIDDVGQREQGADLAQHGCHLRILTAAHHATPYTPTPMPSHHRHIVHGIIRLSNRAHSMVCSHPIPSHPMTQQRKRTSELHPHQATHQSWPPKRHPRTRRWCR